MKVKSVCAAVMAAIALLMPEAVFSQNPSHSCECVVKTAAGLVNWSAGYVEASGTAAIPAQNMGRISARPAAVHDARLAAGRNLLEITKSIAVDSLTTVGALTAGNEIVSVCVEGLIRKAVQTSLLYLPDGTVEVTLRMPLYGELSRALTPSRIEKRTFAFFPTKSRAMPDEAKTAGRAPSGLIIDARGLGFLPAIWPRLYSENGNEIYGLNLTGDTCFAGQGASGYACGIDCVTGNQRAGDDPIIVKALGTGPAGRSDLVIANDDAARVLSLEKKNSFLKQCRVVIVMD